MVDSVSASAVSSSVARTANTKFKMVQTDTHSVIMRQIVALQTQLKDLYQTLAKQPPKDIAQRLLLERQIQGIEDEIAALRSALISTENKKIMEQRKAEADKVAPAKPAGVKPGQAEPIAASKPAARTPATPQVTPATQAAQATQATQPEAIYASDGQNDEPAVEAVGANVDVMA